LVVEEKTKSGSHGIRNEIRASKQQRREGPFDPCQDEGKEGKRETKIDHPWQKVSSLGKRGVKMGR